MGIMQTFALAPPLGNADKQGLAGNIAVLEKTL
jgi:hypothetical protein